jgi:hypothetical protein
VGLFSAGRTALYHGGHGGLGERKGEVNGKKGRGHRLESVEVRVKKRMIKKNDKKRMNKKG